MIAQDGRNMLPVENQNFKMVPWAAIAERSILKCGSDKFRSAAASLSMRSTRYRPAGQRTRRDRTARLHSNEPLRESW